MPNQDNLQLVSHSVFDILKKQGLHGSMSGGDVGCLTLVGLLEMSFSYVFDLRHLMLLLDGRQPLKQACLYARAW